MIARYICTTFQFTTTILEVLILRNILLVVYLAAERNYLLEVLQSLASCTSFVIEASLNH